MRRFYGFLLGLVLGGTSVYVGYQYHLVRTQDRLLVIRKVQPSLLDIYADVRQWGVEDWKKHPALTRHLVASGHSKDVIQSATDELVDEFLEGLQKPRRDGRGDPRAARDSTPR